MDDFLTRVTNDLLGRIDGPMRLRLVVQPLVATVLAVRAGGRDAREGKPPPFWSLAFDPEHRRERLRQGWKDIATLFAAATILDVVYQLVALKRFYPGEALIVASTPRAAGADSLRDTVTVLVVAPCNLIRSILFGASYSGSFGTYTCRNQPFPLMDQFSLTATVQRSYAIRFRPTFVASLVQLNVGNGLYGMPPSDTAVVGFGVIRAGTFGFMVASPTSGTVGTYSFTVDSNPDPRLSCVLTDVTRGVAFDTALYPSGCPSRTVRVLPALDVGARINVTALAQNFPVRIELREDGTENVLATSVAATSGGTASISYTTTTFRFVHVFVAGTNGTVRLTID